MRSIQEIQEELIEEFREAGDGFDQYAYLIELSCLLPPMRAERKTPERAVQGCQSHVWLDAECRDGCFQFAADSDTLIIKGVLYLLQEVFCNQSPIDVAAAQVTFLKETAIMDTFEADRRKGIGFVIRQLQCEAGKMAAADDMAFRN